jgi:hypothetical protein
VDSVRILLEGDLNLVNRNKAILIRILVVGLSITFTQVFSGESENLPSGGNLIAPQVNSMLSLVSDVGEQIAKLPQVAHQVTPRTPETFGELTQEQKASTEIADPGDIPKEALPDATRPTSTRSSDPGHR